MTQGESPFLSVHAAASFLGVHPNTIRRWAHENKLPGQRIGTRGDWRFTKEALQGLLRNKLAPGEVVGRPKPSASQKHMPTTTPLSPVDMLASGGEMGVLMDALDWSSTPVGRMDEWPQSLKTLVATSLRSRFPIIIYWEHKHYTMFYNDASIPVLGKKKHPDWLGRSGQECWQEMWPTIGPIMEGVFVTGQPAWSEDLLLVLDRNLPLEEAYFTFSFSAIPGETGIVAGIFCAVTETTERVLGERRLRTLCDLTSRASEALSAKEACEIATRLLSQNDADLPFVLIYLLDRDRTVAHLVALSGVSPESRAAAKTIPLLKPSHAGIWPFDEVARHAKPQRVKLLADDFGKLPGGPWPESPDLAFVLPLMVSSQNEVTGFLVAGVNPRCLFNETYRDFFTLVAGHIETAVANTRASEAERRRAEALAEIDCAKTAFFSNISHEFRMPLTLMLGSIEETLAEDGMLSKAQREQTALLQRNALRMFKLVNTLLDFSRMEAGRIQAFYAGQKIVSDGLRDIPLTSEGRSPFQYSTPAGTGVLPQAARILFAGDNADMRAYVRRLLQERYHVQTVSNGKAALAAVQEDPPDLVLADVMMLGMDGFAMLHALRSNQATRTLPVILLSDRAGEKAQIEGTQAGADDYLIKPFSAWELQTRVGAHLEMTRLRKEAKEWRKAEQPRLYNLLMQAPAYIAYLRGPDHVFEFANSLYMQIVGPYRTILGKPAREALPEIVGQGYYELLDRIYQTGEPVIEREALIRFDSRGDGTLQDTYADYVYQPARTASGEVEGILVHAVDVTEQVQARERIAASEARFRALVEQVPILVWIAHPDGRGYWYNARWYDYTGTTPEQMDGWGWQVVHDPQVLPEVLQRWERSRQNGEPFEMVFPLRGADGLYRPFLTRVVPIRDAHGTITQWFGTNTDITEQKRLEQQKNEFIGIASHELKTPVTCLKGYAQLLVRKFQQAGDTPALALLQKMDTQLNKLTSLIGDLLDVTKIESGHLQLHLSSFDLNTLIQEVVEEMQRTTVRHTIVLDLAPPVTLWGDPDRIGQVLTNLLTNAIKYSPQSSTIIVKTVQQEEKILTSVQDFGIGISKEMQASLFERFFRVEGDTQSTYPGLGLGLYISAEFVRRHHGDIWAQSEQGKGTTMTFSLPLEQTPKR